MEIIITGFILDLILGDPQGYPHPVRYIGSLISFLEKKLYRENKKIHQLIAGVFLVLLVVSITYLVTYWIIRLTYDFYPVVGFATSAILAYTVLATKCLATEARKVYNKLESNDIAGGRRALSFIVSRDTAHLSETEIARGTIETVAENISDGIIAPLFYLFVGGVPIAMAYKAINTLDSMVGYRNDRYEYFGKTAAYIDDIVNYIPARLSVLFISLASFINWRSGTQAFKMAIRDGRNHKSPNSGYPEASVAGALGIQLGGTNRYFGKEIYKPTIGDLEEPLVKEHIIATIKLMYVAAITGIILFGVISIIVGVL